MGKAVGAGFFYEGDEIASWGEAGDADEGDLITETCFDLCDRRAFCSTRRSPRRPEPEDEVLPLELGEIEDLTVNRDGFTIEHFGRQHIAG